MNYDGYYCLLHFKIDSPEILYNIPLNMINFTLSPTHTFYIPTLKFNDCIFVPVILMLILGKKLKNQWRHFNF